MASMLPGDNYEDVTGQQNVPQDPNSVVLLCNVHSDTFSLIQSDPDLYVIWDQPNPRAPNETPDNAEWGLLNAFLAQQGYTPTQRHAAIGTGINGRSRLQIGDDLIQWIRGN